MIVKCDTCGEFFDTFARLRRCPHVRTDQVRNAELERARHATLIAAVAQLAHEHMPWPFPDIDRHDGEGIDAAWAIAESIVSALEAEFDSLANRTVTGPQKRSIGRR